MTGSLPTFLPPVRGPEVYAMYERPEGHMRGWFEEAEDLAEHLEQGGYRPSGVPWCMDLRRFLP